MNKKSDLLPIIIGSISIIFAVIGITDPEIRTISFIVFFILSLIVIIWLSYSALNERFADIKRNKKEIDKINELLNIHKNIIKLEKRIDLLEAKK